MENKLGWIAYLERIIAMGDSLIHEICVTVNIWGNLFTAYIELPWLGISFSGFLNTAACAVSVEAATAGSATFCFFPLIVTGQKMLKVSHEKNYR